MERKYFDFLNKSVTAYHAVKNIKDELIGYGFTELYEGDAWELTPGGKYFVCRNGSSVIAFVNRGGSFMIAASHSDFPSLAVKNSEKMGLYLKLAVEKYGGGILYSWLDRPLGIAGRAAVSTEKGIELRLVNIDKSVIIPSVAIHMRRDVNDGLKLNPAKDMLPLAGITDVSLEELVAKAVGADEKSIIAHDLYLYNKAEATLAGFDNELIISPRIDNLISARASLLAFLDAKTEATPVLAVFDNEEVGSSTKQGAASTMLHDVLRRISLSEEDYCRRLAGSFMISADNAHALHPNSPELADKDNAPVMGQGLAVKYNSNQRYTTDAASDGVFRAICQRAGVKLQKYYNRADVAGGSTLGSIANTKVSISTVDIGVPQLAMHSSVETCAVSDVHGLEAALRAFYNSTLTVKGNEINLA